jgi:hypothetical protein
VLVPPGAAAALTPSVSSRANANEAIPASCEDRARKAWEYCLEEPLAKNCFNSWRTFAVDEEIKIASDDEKVQWEAVDLVDRLASPSSSTMEERGRSDYWFRIGDCGF